MYRLSKGAISKYIRGECRRRLRLDLYDGADARRQADAPEKDTGRPGLQLIADQGRTYERECYFTITDIFGADAVRHGTSKPYAREEEQAFEDLPLEPALEHLLTPGHFAFEVLYPVTDSFVAEHSLTDLVSGGRGVSLRFGLNRPDILLSIAPAGNPRRIVDAGGRVVEIGGEDPRIGLRIIDVKLSEQPSPAHFAELAYYGMTLAGWLLDNRRTDHFVVLADAAIWPGSHDGSAIRRLEAEELRRGSLVRDRAAYYERFKTDLEEMPAEVVLGRVVRFLAHDLREVISLEDWRDLPLHISSRCIGCDYLGLPWTRSGKELDSIDQRYCSPTAEREQHLSRIAGLTEGAGGKLSSVNVKKIDDLANLSPASRVFETHQNLRAARHIVQARASILQSRGEARLPDRTGTSAIMPRFSDVRVALSADFDVSTGISFALGCQIEAYIPTSVRHDAKTGEVMRTAWGKVLVDGQFERWDQARLVSDKTVRAEGEVFLDFLIRLRDKVLDYRDQISKARGEVAGEAKYKPSIQFYLWDMLNFKQLCRMMGRHLESIRSAPVDKKKRGSELSPIAWIFPPEEVVQEAENVERNSPITIVSEMVRLLAADIPYHYGQGFIANAYRVPLAADRKVFDYRQHPFFADPLSDQIPSERGHEVWAGNKSPFKDQTPDDFQEELRRVVRQRLGATLSVANRLRYDLEKTEDTKLTAEAPSIDRVFGDGDRLSAVAQDLQVIYQHARLMDAAQALEVDLQMATPPFEREARFQSVRLVRRLEDEARRQELQQQRLGGLVSNDAIWVFEMSERSTEAKVKEDEFNLSLMPEDSLHMQHWTLAKLANTFPSMSQHIPEWRLRQKVRKACKISLIRFDRVRRIVIVAADDILHRMVGYGILDLTFEVGMGKVRYGIIDPLHIDYFVGPRLRPALSSIGVPKISVDDPLVDARRLIRSGGAAPRVKETGSAAVPFIWEADTLARPVVRDVSIGLGTLPALVRENLSQVRAITNGLTRRLSLLWGPPGTGKSETSAALLVALVAQARSEGRSVRIAITGPTWVAVDNVMRKLPERLVGQDVLFARLKSSANSEAGVDPALRNFVVATEIGDVGAQELLSRLEHGGTTVIGATAHQLGKLSRLRDKGDPQAFIDYLLIDEASQMDVAHASVTFSALADGASVTVVGDDLQMAPIHPIDPPIGAEHVVGSIYDFFCKYRHGQTNPDGSPRFIAPTMLDVSYRSNCEIIEFVSTTGYPGLTSKFPDQRMLLSTPVPIARPASVPAELPWSDHIARILDPNHPLAAVIHSDMYSSQRNDGEAKLVASLVAGLYGRLVDPETGQPFAGATFFKKGVGIVTPHRAQQSAVIESLMLALQPDAETAEELFRSVDTVERFQGQEKVAMFASFGLGDGDQIASEEDFLYNINRFNVIVSRARTKMVVVLSRRLADYLPKDIKALRDSRLLKHLVYGFLRTGTAFSMPGLEDLGECELRVR
ncbi:helicase [Mesorhizobium sp. M8A.F.Ca.ET.173.01.1.1]|nr:helicase [Mesorhizobium sp. M8A.F.Ca.ET.173.01.1.1]